MHLEAGWGPFLMSVPCKEGGVLSACLHQYVKSQDILHFEGQMDSQVDTQQQLQF